MNGGGACINAFPLAVPRGANFPEAAFGERKRAMGFVLDCRLMENGVCGAIAEFGSALLLCAGEEAERRARIGRGGAWREGSGAAIVWL